MLVVYYLQSFSISLSFHMPRTNVIKSILGRFVPFSFVSLRADIVYELEDSPSLYQIFHHFLRDRSLFMPQVGTEEKRLFGQ